MDALRVLLLAGDAEEADWVEAGLAASGVACLSRRVPTRSAFAAALRGRAPDLILAVPGAAGMDSVEARRRLGRRWPEAPFVVVPGPELEGARDGSELPGLSAWLMPAILRALQESDAAWSEVAACANASERLFQALVETLPHIVWTAGPCGRCVSVNGRWTRFTGLSVESSRDLGWLSALAPEDRQAWQSAWGRAETSGGPFRIECRLRVAGGGSTRWHLARALPVRDQLGAIVGWVGTFSDIDDQKRHEEDLRATARRHAALAALGRRALEGLEPTALMTEVVGMLVDVLAVERAAVQERAGIVVVEARAPGDLFAAVTGPNPDDRPLIERAFELGQPVAALSAPQGSSALVAPARHAVATPIPDPKGPETVLLVTATRIRPFATEDLHFLQSTAHLIAAARTRHRDAHELRAALDTAKDASRAKDRLLNLLGHELRTPLTPILLAVSALQEEPGLPGELRGLLGMIRRNVEIESHLIDDLLDVSRILRGELTFEWSDCDLHEELDRVLAAEAPALTATGLRLEVERSARSGKLQADPARLRQLLGNLLGNAIKFTTPGGSIAVRTRTLPGTAGSPESIRVEVTDSGMGIEPDLLPRVFNPFEQGEGVFTRRYGGLGLGLTICKALAEAHQGRITAASPGPGKGSTFTVDLPVRRRENASPAPSASTPQWPPRVLLVKGDRNNNDSLLRRLRRHNLLVTVVADVATALFAAAAHPFDIVVCDLTLPDGAGLALMPRLKTRYGLSGIALTDVPLKDEQARVAGFSTVLTRPVSFTALMDAIRRTLDVPHPDPSEVRLTEQSPPDH